MTLTGQLVEAGPVAADINGFSAVALRWRHETDAAVAVVQRYGDTTDANTQRQALAHYGVIARLVQTADLDLIEEQITRGISVPCGYIHRGPVNRPTGSGHWLNVVGHTPNHLVGNKTTRGGSPICSAAPPSMPTAWGYS
jgi:hypothetical protein